MTGQLDVIADYADRIASTTRAADATLAEFTAFDELYQAKEWVAEWLEQKPEPKFHSNNWKADSKSRFAQWLRWKLEQEGRNGEVFGWSQTYRNLAAGEIVRRVPTFAHGRKLTERSLRPFNWVLKNRYEERLPEIARAAIEKAGSVDALTSAHTKEAVSDWKHQYIQGRRGGVSGGAIDAALRARRIRAKMLDELAELYKLASQDEKARADFTGLLDDMEAFLDAHTSKDGAA